MFWCLNQIWLNIQNEHPTICNIWDKVVCNLLTKWGRDLKIGQNTGYLAHVMMAKSNLLNIQNEHPHNMQYFR